MLHEEFVCVDGMTSYFLTSLFSTTFFYTFFFLFVPCTRTQGLKKKGVRVAGIGHRIKSKDNRDKRVELLQNYARKVGVFYAAVCGNCRCLFIGTIKVCSSMYVGGR